MTLGYCDVGTCGFSVCVGFFGSMTFGLCGFVLAFGLHAVCGFVWAFVAGAGVGIKILRSAGGSLT